MGFITSSLVMAYTFLYGFNVPHQWDATLIALTIYAVHLAISGGVTFASLKVAGVETDWLSGYMRALFTVFIRDLIGLPLVLLTAFWPMLGVIIALVAWLGLLKFIFQISWLRALLVFIISLILPLVILLFILIPIAIFLM